jgi:hypothetical protein
MNKKDTKRVKNTTQKGPKTIRQIDTNKGGYLHHVSNPDINIEIGNSYFHHDATNWQRAAIDGFRDLYYKKLTGQPVKGFDADLCRSLVAKYHLSCSDCKIEECENHGLDQFR